MKKPYNNLFIFGMFRSATTMLARSLSAHSEITIASDPYFQYFKSFRNEIYGPNISDFDFNSPLSDNFWDDNLPLDKIILEGSLDVEMNHTTLEEVINLIKDYAGRDSEKIIPLLSSVKANNYKDLLSELITIIYEAYGKDSTKFVGFKSTFSELFITPILRALPGSKIICVVRDPRAIFASQIVPKKDYPLLYVVRQWRKSIEYILENIKEENVIVVRYEDLVDNPEQFMKDMSKFIGIDYESDMINPSKYLDGGGSSWSQNSSYDDSKNRQVINNKNKERWKEILSENEIQIIEDLCNSEMKIFGYHRITENNLVDLEKKYNENESDFRTWFREYYYQYEFNEIEIRKEIIRFLYIENKIFDKHLSDKLLLSATAEYINQKLF